MTPDEARQALAGRQATWQGEHRDAALAAAMRADQSPVTAYRPPNAAELTHLLGGPENASRIMSIPDMPLQPIEVVTAAELEARRRANAAAPRNIPGVAYREPALRPVPSETTAALPDSEFIRRSLADGYTWG